jgi:hypothetical protein
MSSQEKLTIILRSEDNCRWVRDRLLELEMEESCSLLP